MNDGKDSLKVYPKRNSGGEMEKSEMESFFQRELNSFRKQLLKEFTDIVDSRVNELMNHTFQRIDEIETVANNNKKAIDKLNKSMKDMMDKTETIKNENETLKRKLKEAIKDIEKAEENMEDKTNHQLRKTLVFTNVKEEQNEQYDVSDVLAREIKKASKNEISKEKALTFIERAHRGKARQNSTGGPRPIFAAINHWRNSELIKEIFLDKKNSTGVYCEQMYGPRTTWRRNQALKVRKDLKSKNLIVKGYVAFPARLMVKKAGDAKYSLHEDFSKREVVFGM